MAKIYVGGNSYYLSIGGFYPSEAEPGAVTFFPTHSLMRRTTEHTARFKKDKEIIRMKGPIGTGISAGEVLPSWKHSIAVVRFTQKISPLIAANSE
jgi:hypothetical protein